MDKTEEWRAIELLDYIRDHCENNEGFYDKTHLINKISRAMDEYATDEVSRERAIEFTIDFVTEKLQNKPNRHVVINAYDKWKSNQEEQ